ncbi:thaumatin-like protein 1 [Prunus yedoensis var. nudiflora]|uniref:Thaumatin-like protein 1 n=1 Tax=Prunus yedoensis var. nudiflora TaxID=2094558 RepID=A0A314ZJG7_PRUYE|nr:thaumatin-like protein 1 [Prunus yedoensis var. nudiflora]
MAPLVSLLVSLLTILGLFASGVLSTTFTMVNKCEYTVWPGILTNAGVPPLPTTGFALQKGETKTISAPTSWGGRFWARTLCSQDSSGKFSCVTGDCGSGKVECAGNGAAPPATLAEFTLDGSGGLDFFDVSLVDGYNLPMLVVPQGGSGTNCSNTGCVVDLNGLCPSELKVTSADGRQGVACKSACEAFQQPQYCCSGAYGTPDTCKPSSYSQIFKNACPHAYSYAYDDRTSTFTCAAADYTITFCPSPSTSKKESQGQNTQPQPTNTTSGTPSSTRSSPEQINNTMEYYGASYDQSQASSSTRTTSHAIAGLVTVALAIQLLSQLVF